MSQLERTPGRKKEYYNKSDYKASSQPSLMHSKSRGRQEKTTPRIPDPKKDMGNPHSLGPYMPQKTHAALKPLVKMCVEKDVGFDFWGDSWELPFTTSMLVRISEEHYMHVWLSGPDECLLEGFCEEIRMNMYTKDDTLVRRKYRVITVDEFDAYVSQTKSPV